ncbi:hypothetical protein MRB53_018280 [Persea americana]|uniref:Uncharacterized protein n=1 Tax=Persea americana TaxID=3435 RepID=A0ACC2M8D5_PERAE|nr:hypothetical protein MRB53_018280 [Persea americana]
MFASGENMFPCPPSRPSIMERKWKPNVELAPNCPRCDSSNTKFCYYNNYSLSQPRYFCKGCRRYWTKGGSLRNVPVGGGCRKNRRGKSLRVSTDHRGVVDGGSSAYARFGSGRDGSDLVGDDPLGNSGLPSEDGIGPSTDMSRPDASGIDLAAVYAKFLNQRSDLDSGIAAPVLSCEFNVSPVELSNSNRSPPPIEFSQETNLVECQRALDPILEAQLSDTHQIYLSEFDLNCKEKDRIGQYTSTESTDFGLQSLSGEGVLQDIFWSSNYQMPSNYTPQSLHQPQGFESVLEDHLTVHPNLQNGNWSSFDLSCYDTFSRP